MIKSVIVITGVIGLTLALASTSIATVPKPKADLVVDKTALIRDLSTFVTGDVQEGDCEIEEGYLTGTGPRTLLMFTTENKNIGREDISIGAPPPYPFDDPTQPQPDAGNWHYDTCHQHWHFAGFTVDKLLDSHGQVVVSVNKQGFCLEDSEQIKFDRRTNNYQTYSRCDQPQGISHGWADIYYAGTAPGQWVDITGLPAGRYTLQVTVNPNRTIPESRYGNNTTRVQVTLPLP